VKFVSPLHELQKSVQAVQRAIPGSSTMPILLGILFEAKNGKLTLTGNNIELGIRCSFPVDIEQEGTVILPGRLFGDIVRKLNNSVVTIQKDDIADQVKIQAGNVVYNINHMQPFDFPALPIHECDFSFTMPTTVFKTLAEQVAFAAGDDESRRFLSSVCLDFKGSTLVAVATNTFRLALKEVNIQSDFSKAEQILIPAKILTEISRIVDFESEIKVSVGKRKIFFEVGNTYIASRLIDEDYIDYPRIIPSKFQTRLLVNRIALLEATERVHLLSDKAIRFSVNDGVCNIMANEPTLGYAKEDVHVAQSGENMDIAMNARYVIDALKSMETEEVEIDLIDSIRPVVIRQKDDTKYIQLIMPVRIKEG
jgi:DNA polymerase-3 subunit beta